MITKYSILSKPTDTEVSFTSVVHHQEDTKHKVQGTVKRHRLDDIVIKNKH